MQSHLEFISFITAAFERSSRARRGCCVCRSRSCICRRRQAAPYVYWNSQRCRRADILLRPLYYLVCARNEMMGMELLAFNRGHGLYYKILDEK